VDFSADLAALIAAVPAVAGAPLIVQDRVDNLFRQRRLLLLAKRQQEHQLTRQRRVAVLASQPDSLAVRRVAQRATRAKNPRPNRHEEFMIRRWRRGTLPNHRDIAIHQLAINQVRRVHGRRYRVSGHPCRARQPDGGGTGSAYDIAAPTGKPKHRHASSASNRPRAA